VTNDDDAKEQDDDEKREMEMRPRLGGIENRRGDPPPFLESSCLLRANGHVEGG
jgi:hypothetical protein